MRLFDTIPYLENEQIILRKIEEKDEAAIDEIASDEVVRRYLPNNLFETGFKDKKEAVREMYNDLFKNKESLFLGICLKQDDFPMVGILEVYNYDINWSKASISVRIRKEYWNKDLAKQSISLIVSYLLNETDIRRVTAHVMTDNVYSCKALESCGFRLRKMNSPEDWGFSQPVLVNKYIIEKFAHINYAKIGEGPKIMAILPGIALQSTIRSADVIAEHFAKFHDYTIYLFDDRDAVTEGYSLRNRAGDVAALMKSLKLKGAYVYGASMGGMVGQILAIDHPDLVKKLFIASTNAKTESDTIAMLQKWMDLAKPETLSKLVKEMIRDIYSENTITKFGDFLEKNIGPVTEEEMKQFIILAKAVQKFDCLDEMDKIKCPVYVIGSVGDKVISEKAIRKLGAASRAKVNLYGPEYGHGVYDEAPDLKERMLEFFEE